MDKINTGRKVEEKRVHGSLTVEAAFVIPLCFFVLVLFLYLFLFQYTQLMVYQSMLYASEQIYEKGTIAAYIEKSRIFEDTVSIITGDDTEEFQYILNLEEEYLAGTIGTAYIKELMTDYFDDNDIELDLIREGEKGISLNSSYAYAGNEKIVIKAEYSFEFPIAIFNNKSRHVEQYFEMNGFFGWGWEKSKEFYDEPEDDNEEETPEDTVYVTENGTVYHTDRNCTYINVKLKKVSLNEIPFLRSKSNAIYYPCESCGDISSGKMVYITDYGTRYHFDKECGRIERDVTEISKEYAESKGMGECKKCGKD